GGDFDYFGARTGSFASISTATGTTNGKISTSVDEVAGNAGAPGPSVGVRAIVSDGSGGWFVGGDFKYVGGHPHPHLAHLRSDGSVDPTWDPQLDGAVYALALSGDNLYVGGSFGTADGVAHRNVIKISASTGTVSS